MEKKRIVAFDFDGTITSKDTLFLFIIFAKGYFRFYCGFLLFLPLFLAYMLKIYPNYKLKQQFFSFFFKGKSISDFDKICENFANAHTHIIKSKAKLKIHEYIEQNVEMVIITASIENWVAPFAKKLGIQQIIGTKIEKNDKKLLTGNFSSKNCYGKEKVNRLLQKFPDRENYYLVAFGDSNGDKDLLNFADEKYNKAF